MRLILSNEDARQLEEALIDQRVDLLIGKPDDKREATITVAGEGGLAFRGKARPKRGSFVIEDYDGRVILETAA